MSSLPRVLVVPASTLARFEYVSNRRERAYNAWRMMRASKHADRAWFFVIGWDRLKNEMLKSDSRLFYV